MSTRLRAWSLRARLVAIVAFVCIATLLAGVAAMYRADRMQDKKALDVRLIALAQTVQAFAEHEIEAAYAGGHRGAIQVEAVGTFGTRFHYQIWGLDGTLLLQSHKGPVIAPMQPLTDRGFGKTEIDGEEFRTYVEEGSKGGLVIQIAERMSDRAIAMGTLLKYFSVFLALPLLLIIACTWWFLNRALHSVDDYAAQLRQRHALDLSELASGNPPTELRPMVDSINALFARFRETLGIEREFTAIAAHEMRTPLAGLRAHAQLAVAHSGSPQELAACLGNLMSGIDHASHLLDRLLDLARVESLALAGAHGAGTANLERVYWNVMAELGPTAAEREVSLKTSFEVGELPAVELGVHMLMHNLLVNAIRYTPSGGRIEVRSALHEQGQAILVSVDDSGPGIPPHRHAEAFQRFNRLGRMDGHGVGLGLSIVQAVATAHHAVVRLLQSPLGGLRAEVRFPAVPPPSVAAWARRPPHI